MDTRQQEGSSTGHRIHHLDISQSEPISSSSPNEHYHIAVGQKNPVDIGSWCKQHADDPALQNFLPDLRDHLLARLLEIPYEGDEHNFTDADRETVIFKDNQMYSHQVLWLNYTMYDLRQAQDTINPSTPHCYVMLKAYDDQTSRHSHPLWYAQVLGIFHIWVIHTGPRSKSLAPKRFNFLWIRWLGPEPSYHAGWNALCLDHIGFMGDEQDSPSFGILDPSTIICAAHLIPAFAYGYTHKFLGPSFIRRDGHDEDWESFYVNRFVDQDMFMCYFGGGVGHLGQAVSHIHWQAPKDVDATQPPDEEDQDHHVIVDSDEELDIVELDDPDDMSAESDGGF